jgi:hypothetical protein
MFFGNWFHVFSTTSLSWAMPCNFQEYLSYDYHNTWASNMLQKKKQGWMHNWCIQLPNYKARFLLLIKWQAQWSSDVPKEIGRGHSDTDYSMQPSTYSSKYKWEIAVTCFSIKDGTQSQKLAKQNPRYVQMTFNTICETSSSQFYQFILNTSTQQ